LNNEHALNHTGPGIRSGLRESSRRFTSDKCQQYFQEWPFPLVQWVMRWYHVLTSGAQVPGGRQQPVRGLSAAKNPRSDGSSERRRRIFAGREEGL
jgi:hypothetical protein